MVVISSNTISSSSNSNSNSNTNTNTNTNTNANANTNTNTNTSPRDAPRRGAALLPVAQQRLPAADGRERRLALHGEELLGLDLLLFVLFNCSSVLCFVYVY